MNDKHLHNIQVGDLVKIRSPGPYGSMLAVVLAIEPSHLRRALHMREVEVLIANMRLNFMMYELKKI